MVWPFLILSPTSTNFFAPGSGDKYAVPIIGDLILILSESSVSFRTALVGDTTAPVLIWSFSSRTFRNFTFFSVLIL